MHRPIYSEWSIPFEWCIRDLHFKFQFNWSNCLDAWRDSVYCKCLKPYCVSFITVIITIHNFSNVLQTIHFHGLWEKYDLSSDSKIFGKLKTIWSNRNKLLLSWVCGNVNSQQNFWTFYQLCSCLRRLLCMNSPRLNWFNHSCASDNIFCSMSELIFNKFWIRFLENWVESCCKER